MTLVKLYSMDFTCDCGKVVKDVPVVNRVFCQQCGSHFELTLSVSRQTIGETPQDQPEAPTKPADWN